MKVGERVKKNTRKNIAYNYLREAILTWKIPPGSPIIEQEISNQLGISRTPVREALKLLEAEGLLKGIPQRGTFVSELSTQDVEEIFTLRETLEVQALQVAIHNILSEDLYRLEVLCNSLLIESTPEKFIETDRYLHGLIVKNGENERLAKFLDSLYLQVERISVLRPNRFQTSTQEHLRIIKAIKSRDLMNAKDELCQHIRNVKQGALEVCRNIWWADRLG